MDARKIQRTGWLAASVALLMLAAAYASVPLYRLFCQATGFGGTTQRAEAASAPTARQLAAMGGKTISIRFDANVAPGLPWTFKPAKTHETIKIGERRMAFYRATNTSSQPIVGQAVFNVSPDTAGAYFVKIACFCFTEQRLAPGQSIEMPVTYYVDPAILNDPDGRRIDEITLSYTFYAVDEPAARKTTTTARLAPAPNQG